MSEREREEYEMERKREGEKVARTRKHKKRWLGQLGKMDGGHQQLLLLQLHTYYYSFFTRLRIIFLCLKSYKAKGNNLYKKDGFLQDERKMYA